MVGCSGAVTLDDEVSGVVVNHISTVKRVVSSLLVWLAVQAATLGDGVSGVVVNSTLRQRGVVVNST